MKFSKIIFNHIPKCGGSSFKTSLYKACLSNPYFSQTPIYISEFTHNNICLQKDNQYIPIIHNDTKLFADHSYAYFFEKTFNLDISSTFRIISIRHPILRFISHMYFFDKLNPEYCSYNILKEKTKEYGNITIDYLTYFKYGHLNLDIETKYNIAIEELSKYNFIIKSDYMNESITELNHNNPFGLILEESRVNTNNYNANISKKVLQNLKSLLQFEILLLQNFYPNIQDE
jgi:hypothetical protein